MSEQPRTRRRRRRSHFPTQLVLLCLVAGVAMILILMYAMRSLSPSADAQPQATPTATVAPSTPTPETPTPSPEATQSTVYDFSSPVPQSDPVDESYFDDAVFIGDSRTEGLILYTGLTNATNLTHKGLMVDIVFTKQVINQNGQMVTVMDALKNTQFSKVYIMLGINEMGWPYPETFIEKYAAILDAIREINPEAIIYVQEIMPVSQTVSDTHSYISNDKINQFNQLIQEMAQEKKAYYLQVSQAVADSTGCLPQEAGSDGIHLTPTYCQKWLDYLLCHTVTP